MRSSPKTSNSSKKVSLQHFNSPRSNTPASSRSSRLDPPNSSKQTTPRSSRTNTPISSKEASSEFYGNATNARYDAWTKQELVNYYTLKVAEYEKEVGNQMQLLKKRKAILDETKDMKSDLYRLIRKRDSLSEEATRIEKEIELLEANEQ